MTGRKVLIGCGIAMLVLLVAIAGGGLYIFHQIAPSLNGRLKAPSAFAHPGIVTGSGFLSKSEFIAEPVLGNVTDIVPGKLDPTPGVEMGIAGTQGSVFIDNAGHVKCSVSFGAMSMYTNVSIVSVRGKDTCEFMNRGSWASKPALLDHTGKVLWEYTSKWGADDMTAGDLKGDGSLEFAVGLNGSGGVVLLNSTGRTLWSKPDGNVWHVEIADVKGDGRLEIVHSNAGGKITVRDASGNVISKSAVGAGVYFSDFSLCTWPTKKDVERLLVSSKGAIWLLDFGGGMVKKFDAPDCPDLSHARGALVTLRSGHPEYLAVLVDVKNSRQSLFYVYNSEGKLVYHEILPEPSASIAAIAADKSGAESILVGGEGHVTRYSTSAAAPRK
jgi:hypothetical protein